MIYNNTTGGFGATFVTTTIPAGVAIGFIYSNSTWVATVPSSTSVSADNGVNINTGTNVELGGALTKTTTVSLAGNTLNIGNDAANNTLTLGSTNGTSATTIQSGSNAVNINAANNQPTNINTTTSTGAVKIGNSTGTNVYVPGFTTAGVVHNSAAGLLSSSAVSLTADVSGILPIANGGTGSATQGWVDLTTAQTAAGNKTWSGIGTFSSGTASTTSTNGAVVVTGGEGISGALNVGGTETVTGLVTQNGGLTEVGTAAINNSGAATTNIGVSGTGAVNIGNATGKTFLPALSTAGVVHNAATGQLSTSLVSLTADVTGILPIANGGTGSATQGWVDLTSAQTAAGVKTWSSNGIFNASVGVGTTPNDKFDVLASGGKDVLIGGGATTGSELKLTNSGTAHFSIYNSGNSNLTFANTSTLMGTNTAGTALMSISSTGYVGIGNTSPAFGIDDNTANSATFAKFGSAQPVYIVANSPMIGFNTWWNSTYTYGTSSYAGLINFNQELSGGFNILTAPSGTGATSATMTSRMSITNAGLVGIGTTSPAGLLHVVTPSNNGNTAAWSNGNVVIGQSGTTGAGLGLSYSTSDNGGTAYLSALAPSISWEYMGFRASNFIYYVNGGTEAMRVNSSANVLIGTTTNTNNRLQSYLNTQGNGSSYLYGGTYAAGSGAMPASLRTGGSTNAYQYGLVGEKDQNYDGAYYWDYRSAGVLGTTYYSGSSYSWTSWGALGYFSSGATNYGLYYTSSGSGGGYLPSSSATGVGTGGTGDFIGSWTKGGVLGHIAAGEMAAGYNLGNVYTSGHNVEIVKSGEQRVAAYSSSSTEATVNKSGKGQLSGGRASVSFDAGFAALLSKEEDPIVTITPIGNCNGIHIVSITKEGFEVEENNNGTASIAFTYIVMGKRVDASSATLPADMADKNFDEHLKGFMFNENNKEQNASPMWWDGTKIRYDAIPKGGGSAKK